VTFTEAVDWVGRVVDAAGVGVIALGIAYASLRFLLALRSGVRIPDPYRAYRQSLGRAILLGLEFLVAGDIVRTVATEPTFRSVGVLAVIVAIRTFLSLELELEIEGRWPWQHRPESAATGD
jgi:uncharacterized membrane protein